MKTTKPIIASFAAILAASSWAATWTGGGSSSLYTDTANWKDNTIPASNADITFAEYTGTAREFDIGLSLF